MNSVHLIGRVVKEPELRESSTGVKVVNLVLETEETWSDREGAAQTRIERHKLVFWAKNAELVHESTHEGDQLGIEGKLQTRDWTDRNDHSRQTTEVNVTRIHFLEN